MYGRNAVVMRGGLLNCYVDRGSGVQYYIHTEFYWNRDKVRACERTVRMGKGGEKIGMGRKKTL